MKKFLRDSYRDKQVNICERAVSLILLTTWKHCSCLQQLPPTPSHPSCFPTFCHLTILHPSIRSFPRTLHYSSSTLVQLPPVFARLSTVPQLLCSSMTVSLFFLTPSHSTCHSFSTCPLWNGTTLVSYSSSVHRCAVVEW